MNDLTSSSGPDFESETYRWQPRQSSWQPKITAHPRLQVALSNDEKTMLNDIEASKPVGESSDWPRLAEAGVFLLGSLICFISFAVALARDTWLVEFFWVGIILFLISVFRFLKAKRLVL